MWICMNDPHLTPLPLNLQSLGSRQIVQKVLLISHLAKYVRIGHEIALAISQLS